LQFFLALYLNSVHLSLALTGFLSHRLPHFFSYLSLCFSSFLD
jgi:hypothetical protein